MYIIIIMHYTMYVIGFYLLYFVESKGILLEVNYFSTYNQKDNRYLQILALLNL